MYVTSKEQHHQIIFLSFLYLTNENRRQLITKIKFINIRWFLT